MKYIFFSIFLLFITIFPSSIQATHSIPQDKIKKQSSAAQAQTDAESSKQINKPKHTSKSKKAYEKMRLKKQKRKIFEDTDFNHFFTPFIVFFSILSLFSLFVRFHSLLMFFISLGINIIIGILIYFAIKAIPYSTNRFGKGIAAIGVVLLLFPLAIGIVTMFIGFTGYIIATLGASATAFAIIYGILALLSLIMGGLLFRD